MSLILCIETSTKVCSVALSKNGEAIAIKESNDANYSHAENLTSFIQEVFSKTNFELKNIDAVAVSKGPGSYTGLRIGVSTAKGLCYALGKPLIAISSLKAMASGYIRQSLNSSFTYYCPMIDARRMEVYCAMYDNKLNEINKTAAVIIDPTSFSEQIQKNKIIFFGDGAMKCRAEINHANAIFVEGIVTSASPMAAISEKKYQEKKFEDVAYFEPFYLKDFVSATPPTRTL